MGSMATSLTQQLKKVSLALGKDAPPNQRDSQASVLYSAREAADTDQQTIHNNALFGLEQLSRTEVRFQTYRASLFSPSTLGLDRDQLTQEELTAVNKSISGFLRLLSPHFLSPGAFKAIEYLIRKYRVHRHNVKELVGCGLPFHSTNQFVRVVQACQLEGSVWAFLRPMQQSGAALPRNILVQRCLADRELLRYICEAAKAAAAPDKANRMMISLYAVEEDVVRLLLPYLLHGVGSGDDGAGLLPDYRSGTNMILVQLATIATLAPDFLEVLMQQIAKNAGEGEQQQVLMVLSHLVASQPQLKSIPSSALKAIMRMSDVAEGLKVMQQKEMRLTPLLQLLVPALAQHLHSPSYCKLLRDLVQHVPLGKIAGELTCSVLKAAAADPQQATELQSLLRALDLRYPSQVDEAVNAALQQDGNTSTEGGGGELASFVSTALASSARAPIAGSSATMAHAVDAPSGQLRVQALKQLDELHAKGDLAPEDRAFVQSALERRLADDDASVLDAVLGSKALHLLPPESAMDGLCRLLEKAQRVIGEPSTSKSSRKHMREIAKRALRVLTEVAAETHNGRVVAELLNFVLPAMIASRKLAMRAVKLGKKLGHPLIVGFVEADGDEPGSPQGNDGKKDDATAANLAAIKHVSEGMQHLSSAEIVSLSTQTRAPGRHLLLLALLHAIFSGGESAAKAAAAVMALVQADWSAISGDPLAEGVNAGDSFSAEGLPSPAYLEAALPNSGLPHTALLQRTLLAALQHSYPPELAPQLFRSLAVLEPKDAFTPHLMAVVRSVGPGAAVFLSDIFAAPAIATEAEQLRSLGLLADLWSDDSLASEALDLSTLLPRLLAAASDASAAVREAALDCFASLPDAKHAHLSAKHLAEFKKALVEQRQAVLGDADAMEDLLRCSLTAAGHARSKSKSSGLNLSQAAAQAVADFLLSVLAQQEGPAGIHAARTALHCLSATATPAARLAAAACALTLSTSQASQAGTEAEELALEVLELFTPEAAATSDNSRRSASKQADTFPAELLANILVPEPNNPAPHTSSQMRIAAAQRITPELYEALSPQDRSTLALALLKASSQDAVNECRIAAHTALEPLPLDASILLPLLAPPQAELQVTTPAPKRSRKSGALKTPAKSRPQVPVISARLQEDQMNAALEVLQWKRNILNSGQLMVPLTAVLRSLLDRLLAPAEIIDADEDSDAEGSVRSSTAEYSMQLALNALRLISGESEAGLEGIDVWVLVECARTGSSAATRNAALSLLGKLTSMQPQTTLHVILQVVAALGSAAATQADTLSHDIASATLQAVAPAWLAAGKSPKDLAQAILDSIAPLPQHRALPLLSALLSALPQEEGLLEMMQLLLERALEARPEVGAGEPMQLEEADTEPEEVLIGMAASLCHQAPLVTQLKALAGLLACFDSLSSQQLHEPLPMVTAAFVSTRVCAAAARNGGAHDPQVQEGLQAVMQHALHQIQVLGAQTGKQASRWQRVALKGMSQLLAALEAVMAPGAYLGALLALLRGPQESMTRRALRLFQTKVADPAGMDADGISAAMQLCAELPGLLEAGSAPGTKQAALVALSALATAHGKQDAQALLNTIPAVLAQVSDPSWALRSSALATLSATVTALTQGIVPVLPTLLPAVLAAADTAVAALLGEDAGALEASEDAEMADGDDESENGDASGYEAAGTNVGTRKAVQGAERSELSARAALAAVGALVDSVGAFLSPQLTAILALLLRASLVQTSGPAAQAAAQIREQLPAVVPARLLLPALFSHLDAAFKEGEASAVALIQMVSVAISRMKSAAAASHADALWAFLLRALDVRQQHPGPLAGQVEATATQLLVKATLKLSEARFKPLFLRLLDWAATPLTLGEPSVARQAALFAVVNALAEQLRSVFVPYYRNLLDLAVGNLTVGSEDKQTGKKKRKKTPETAATTSDSKDSWLLRLRVVRSLHRCFLYDTVGFLDEARFHRLLPPLVAQLAAVAPQPILLAMDEDARSEVAPQSSAADGKGAQAGTNANLDVMGRAAVGALVQMAVTVASDTQWKPLHHQVLMATRSSSMEERQRALAVVVQMADRLGEEYMVLLPEAMPFLAELLEDPEHPIQEETRSFLRKLEELTGESLDEYLKL